MIQGLRNIGVPLPWMGEGSARTKAFYRVYNFIILSILCYQLTFGIYSVIVIEDFQERCRLGNITSIATNSIMLTLYYMWYQSKIETFFYNCNSLSQSLLELDVKEAGYFRHLYLKVAENNNSFTKKVLLFVCWTPVIYCIPVPVVDAIHHSYRTNLPLPVLSPYPDRLPGLYELTVFLHTLALVVAVTLKFGNDCLFLALFKIYIVYLRYLTVSIKRLGEQLYKNNNQLTKDKLISWIKTHNEIVRNATELISLYTPVICIYYANLIVSVVFGIFTQIKNDRDGMLQRIGLGGFCIISLLQLYLQCSTNESVGIEAEKVAFEIYNTPWYELDKSNADMVRLMLLVGNKPVDITAFKAPTFRLNREAFVGFMASTITAVMTFSKMNDRHK